MFQTPVEFNQVREEREVVVVERLKDIRTLQRSFRSKYDKFAGSWEELINFYKTDSMLVEYAEGSEDDSASMDKLVRIQNYIKMSDTLLNHRGRGYNIDDIQYIPYSEIATGAKVKFTLDTATIITASEVAVPVFQAFAQYPTFLGDLDKQELINYRDERVNTLKRADGLKVGDITITNNEAGNWE